MKNQYLHKFLEWARLQENISAVALVGSAARVDHPADEWSDIDLVVVADDPQAYLTSIDWLTEICNPWFSILERTPAGDPIELRILFEGGLDMDIILVPIIDARQVFQMNPMVLEIMGRGFQVLWDKDRLLSTLPVQQLTSPRVEPPSLQAFLEVVNDFWFHTAWTAKKLQRGETWIAKSCCDHYLKGLLLRMVEWEAKAARGWELDTWYNGRFLEAWAEPVTLAELPQVFAYYDREDIWRALFATMTLFGRIARQTAVHLNYLYPSEQEEQVSEWISLIHQQATGKTSEKGNGELPYG